MASVLISQLDFILFFYGFAFILLGAVCFDVVGKRSGYEAWAVFGTFAFLHGAGEWLDLTALIAGDSPAFKTLRVALTTISFLFLMESARRNLGWLGIEVRKWWIYIVLIILVGGTGIFGGVSLANVVTRCTIGFPAALGMSLVFAHHARRQSGLEKWSAYSIALCLALYGIAAGLIVPSADFWPVSVINATWFRETTGIPIQLIRGVLACWLAASIWALRQRVLVKEVASERYTASARRQGVALLLSMAVILTLGWILTEGLGRIYQRDVEQEARGLIDLVTSRADSESVAVDGMAMVLAGADAIIARTSGAGQADAGRAKSVLDLGVAASRAANGYVLDSKGVPLEAAGLANTSVEAASLGSAAFVQAALLGQPGRHFAYDEGGGSLFYYASYPVRRTDGAIEGVVVLEKSLNALAADANSLNRPFCIIDPRGVVVLANRPSMVGRSMWPLPPAEGARAVAASPPPIRDAMLTRPIVDATWAMLDGDRVFLRRSFLEGTQWSIVIAMPPMEIYASRVVGIAITFFAASFAMIYLLGKEHSLRGRIQTDQRAELRELARELEAQATTDQLTGLYNRHKFNDALAKEMLRAEPLQAPLSLILYDIDHFKAVNDIHGHQVGDKALVRLSRLMTNLIRKTDILARWGGEEFIILAAETDGQMAYRAAQRFGVAISKIEFEEVGPLTCSFGIAQYESGDTPETFVARADEALYRAKLNGRNRAELATGHPV